MEQPTQSLGMQRQVQIYLGGLSQEKPQTPVSYAALRARAREVMTPEAFDYVDGGAGSEDTMRENREAFRRWRIVPRMMRNVEQRDLSVEVLGQRLLAPVLLAPIGVLSIVHEAAEVGVAQAASALGMPMILSTASSNSIEEVAEAYGDGVRWSQFYWPRSRELAASFAQRAEAAGYGALVVTLDTTLLAWRDRDIGHAYLPFLFGEGLGTYFSDPVFRAMLDEPPEENPTQAILTFIQQFGNPTLTWDDVDWLREQTGLPILLKGILHPDDARKALDHGADGIVVSNHGGRQMDGALAALDALPPIVQAVGERVPVLVDSGIRRGADAFKAVALGASAVLLGRPYAFGLGADGVQGVTDVLLNFLADLDLTLGLAGCTSFAEVSRDHLVHLEEILRQGDS